MVIQASKRMKGTGNNSSQKRNVPKKSVQASFRLKPNKWQTKAARILGLTNIEHYKNPPKPEIKLPCKPAA